MFANLLIMKYFYFYLILLFAFMPVSNDHEIFPVYDLAQQNFQQYLLNLEYSQPKKYAYTFYTVSMYSYPERKEAVKDF